MSSPSTPTWATSSPALSFTLERTNYLSPNETPRISAVTVLIRVVGLAWEELARALLKPNCEYDTRNVCVFRNVVHELTTAGGMDDRNVAAMIIHC